MLDLLNFLVQFLKIAAALSIVALVVYVLPIAFFMLKDELAETRRENYEGRHQAPIDNTEITFQTTHLQTEESWDTFAPKLVW